jgi:DNA replication protein DnaC
VLVLDDWGISPINSRGLHQLMELVEGFSGAGSIIITSQLPVEKWHEYLGEVTVADAIMDRIVHNSHKVVLKGDSMRKHLNSSGGKA